MTAQDRASLFESDVWQSVAVIDELLSVAPIRDGALTYASDVAVVRRARRVLDMLRQDLSEHAQKEDHPDESVEQEADRTASGGPAGEASGRADHYPGLHVGSGGRNTG